MRIDLYMQVKDLLSEDDFRARISEEMEAWGGLLDKDAAGLLVVDALGRNEVAFGKVADLYEGGEALLDVKVNRIGPIRSFTRKDGEEGRVVDLTVSDASGTVRLILGDAEVDLITSTTVREGSRLKIVDGRVRRRRQGLEVTTGKWGVLLPEELVDASEAPRSQFRF